MMTDTETRVLVGAFLIVIGVFLPWHGFQYGYHVPGVIGEITLPTVPGYRTVPGIATLLSALILAVLVLVPHRPENRCRVLAAATFTAAVSTALLLIGGIIPLFASPRLLSPHVGIAVVLVGCILALLSLRRARGEHCGD